MWDLIVSVPDHCLSFYFDQILYRKAKHYCVFAIKRLVTCSSSTNKLYTEGLTELFMNELFTCNSNGH